MKKLLMVAALVVLTLCSCKYPLPHKGITITDRDLTAAGIESAAERSYLSNLPIYYYYRDEREYLEVQMIDWDSHRDGEPGFIEMWLGNDPESFRVFHIRKTSNK